MNTKPTRVRVRAKPKPLRSPEQIAEEQAFIEAGGIIVASPDEARMIAEKERRDLATSLTVDDLRAKLSDLTGIRQRAASEIERLASEHAAMTRNLLAIDGAIQAVSELVEAAEGKGAADA